MEIPYNDLSEAALMAIIEEYVTREGTDYGDSDYFLAEKVAQVKQQILSGRVLIDFDPDSQTCQLLEKG